MPRLIRCQALHTAVVAGGGRDDTIAMAVEHLLAAGANRFARDGTGRLAEELARAVTVDVSAGESEGAAAGSGAGSDGEPRTSTTDDDGTATVDFKDLFARVDTDNNGLISKVELIQYCAGR